LLGALVVAAVALPLSLACGISLGSDADDSELFTRLTVTGDFVPLGGLTLTLEYAQPYPVDIEVACEVRDPDRSVAATPQAVEPTATPVTIPPQPKVSDKKLYDILAERVPANPSGGPFGTATPAGGVIERSFAAPEQPGSYEVRCYTPGDANNVIKRTITIR
jgi:hypothetical protein